MANTTGPGVGLLIFGLMMAIFGGVADSICTTGPSGNGTGPDCGGFAILIGIGVVLLIAGIVLIAISFSGGARVIQQVPDPSVPPPLIQPVVVQQTVEKEIVKVRCSYCGNLCDVTAKNCPSCGASIA